MRTLCTEEIIEPSTVAATALASHAPSRNDAGRAQRFVERFGKDIRFVPEREAWLTWSNDRWQLDTDGALMRLAVTMSQEMLAAAGANAGIDETSSRLRADAVKEALACGDRRNIADYIHLVQCNK
jgi:hypothetical protein